MAEFKLTNKAVDDLSKIWNYTFEEWSENQADKYYQMLIENFQKIADNPFLGKNYNGITPKLLGLKAEKYIIFYRILNKDVVEITRILHEKMDLKHRIIE